MAPRSFESGPAVLKAQCGLQKHDTFALGGELDHVFVRSSQVRPHSVRVTFTAIPALMSRAELLWSIWEASK